MNTLVSAQATINRWITLHKWHARCVIIICHLLHDVCSEVLAPLQRSESPVWWFIWASPRITCVDIFTSPSVCFSVIHPIKMLQTLPCCWLVPRIYPCLLEARYHCDWLILLLGQRCFFLSFRSLWCHLPHICRRLHHLFCMWKKLQKCLPQMSCQITKKFSASVAWLVVF